LRRATSYGSGDDRFPAIRWISVAWRSTRLQFRAAAARRISGAISFSSLRGNEEASSDILPANAIRDLRSGLLSTHANGRFVHPMVERSLFRAEFNQI